MAISPLKDNPAFEPLHHLTARSQAPSHPRGASRGGPVRAAAVLPLPPGAQPCILVEPACVPQPHRRYSFRSTRARRNQLTLAQDDTLVQGQKAFLTPRSEGARLG